MQKQPFCYSPSLLHNIFGNMFLCNRVGNNVFCITGQRTGQEMNSASSRRSENHLLNAQSFCFYWQCIAASNRIKPQSLACLQLEIYWTFTTKSNWKFFSNNSAYHTGNKFAILLKANTTRASLTLSMVSRFMQNINPPSLIAPI